MPRLTHQLQALIRWSILFCVLHACNIRETLENNVVETSDGELKVFENPEEARRWLDKELGKFAQGKPNALDPQATGGNNIIHHAVEEKDPNMVMALKERVGKSLSKHLNPELKQKLKAPVMDKKPTLTKAEEANLKEAAKKLTPTQKAELKKMHALMTAKGKQGKTPEELAQEKLKAAEKEVQKSKTDNQGTKKKQSFWQRHHVTLKKVYYTLAIVATILMVIAMFI